MGTERPAAPSYDQHPSGPVYINKTADSPVRADLQRWCHLSLSPLAYNAMVDLSVVRVNQVLPLLRILSTHTLCENNYSGLYLFYTQDNCSL